MADPQDAGVGRGTLTIPVEGMTCASCVLRVEKALKKVEGVSAASVNLATEQTTITFDPLKVTVDRLRDAVSDAGYSLGKPIGEENPEESAERYETGVRRLKFDLALSAGLTLPVMLISMSSMTSWFHRVVPLDMKEVNEILLLLTAPVLLYAGRRFFKGFWKTARHGTADMNTLVAVGTGAAFLYSAVATLVPGWLAGAARGESVYYDTAATIITLILAGRYLEARARRRASDALRSLPVSYTHLTLPTILRV